MCCNISTNHIQILSVKLTLKENPAKFKNMFYNIFSHLAGLFEFTRRVRVKIILSVTLMLNHLHINLIYNAESWLAPFYS